MEVTVSRGGGGLCKGGDFARGGGGVSANRSVSRRGQGGGMIWWLERPVHSTSDSSISETHLSPTSWVVGSKPGGQAAGGSS